MSRAKQSMDGNTAAAHVAYAYTEVAGILSTIICIVYEQCGRIYFLKPFHTIVL